MSIEDFIRKAADLRLDGIDVTVYYLKSTEPGYLEGLRYLAFKNAIPILGAACGSRTVEADAAKRAEVLADIRKWVDVSSRLGAPQLRIMAGNLPDGAPLSKAIDWVVETMKAATDYSGSKGIVLSIENNHGVTQTPDACVEIMNRVASPYAGITLDVTHFVATSAHSPYDQIAACIPFATNTHVFDRFDDGSAIDMDRIFKSFADAGYRGYMSLEYDGGRDQEDRSEKEIPVWVAAIRDLCRRYSEASA